MADTHFASRSSALTYSLRQLPVRDEIVFKSVLRVLQGKTRHAWEHTDAAGAELLICGAGALAGGSELNAGPAFSGSHPGIQISTAAGTGSRALAWPLRIADLISCLDLAGDEILSRPRSAVPVPLAPEPGMPAPASAAVASIPASQPITLIRWPGPALLKRDARYLKLATMLTGQPVTLMEMAERSGLPLALCREFAELLKAELLIRRVDEPSPAVRPLSVGTAGPVRAAAASAQPGLIARIRLRLEMFVGTPTAK